MKVKTAIRKTTTLRMVLVQACRGMCVKSFRLVWIFGTAEAFDKFINAGWELDGQTNAAAPLDGQGTWAAGAWSLPSVSRVHQPSNDGLALALSAKGTK